MCSNFFELLSRLEPFPSVFLLFPQLQKDRVRQKKSAVHVQTDAGHFSGFQNCSFFQSHKQEEAVIPKMKVL